MKLIIKITLQWLLPLVEEVIMRCYRWSKKTDKICWNAALQKWYVILILSKSGVKLTNWKCFVLYLKATVMSNCLFAFVKTWETFKGECYAKETDEVSRLSMRFALILTSTWLLNDVQVKWSWSVAWIFAYRIKTWHAQAHVDLQQSVVG